MPARLGDVRLVTSNARGLTVLLTNLILAGRSGTELVVRNLARALVGLGHHPIVYAGRLGGIADEVRGAGVPVVSDIRALRGPVDVIHGHHLPTTVAALALFPHVPALFVCHDFVAWHDSPPLFPSVRRFVAVDDTVAERLRDAGVPPARLRVILNQPDLGRFMAGTGLPERPRRALAFAKNEGHLEAIQAACGTRGIALDIVGPAVQRPLDAPEQVLPRYDLVFASALTAMEAMACGRGVVVCDGRGLAGWVSPSRFDEWRRRNFGLRTFGRALTPDGIGEEIDRFSPAEAWYAQERLRAEGGVQHQAEAFIALYREMLAEPGGDRDEAAFRVAMAAYVQEWSPAAREPGAWLRERADLLERIEMLATASERCAWGTTYALNDPASDPFVRPLQGFSFRESAGRWTDGPSALLSARAPGSGRPAALRLRFQPFLAASHQTQHVMVDVNGLDLGNWIFSYQPDAGTVEVTVAIPADRIPDDGRLWVRIRLPDAVAPAAIGAGPDPRQLGVNMMDVRLDPAAS
ncbi:MAG: glycosyltransferase [Acidobacteria bacterium]|nr:glycosyltransferase [Acidobacteriota bacterium]